MTTANLGDLTDCHAHLGDPCFDADRGEVLERARAAGVERVLMVGETLSDAERNLELAAQHSGRLFACAGLYPTVLELDQAEALVELIRRQRDQLVAIGEVGLDHWKVQDPADLELQHRIFARFVELSLELDLPLNVHSRSAGSATIELLLEKGARRVLLHAFDGRAVKARPALEAGYFFSVPPSIERSRQKQKLVRQLPLDCLLLETDSPVLGPTGDERNEPANARRSLEAIAAAKSQPAAVVAEAMRNNTRRLFFPDEGASP